MNYRHFVRSSGMNLRKCEHRCGCRFLNSTNESPRLKRTFPPLNPAWIVSKPAKPKPLAVPSPPRAAKWRDRVLDYAALRIALRTDAGTVMGRKRLLG